MNAKSIPPSLYNGLARNGRRVVPAVPTVRYAYAAQVSRLHHSSVENLISKASAIAPCFELGKGEIKILREPADFYSTLKHKIVNAKSRVFLSTLYIGKKELELVAIIREALSTNKNLEVSILTDALRGTRESPNPSAASILAPLIEEFGDDRIEVRMFHTPNLRGLKKKYIPKRFNEGWGLQHMKLYGFDNEIILSGANLSDDYFTNRQDRYHMFSSGKITDYYAKIQSTVCSLSYKVQPDDTLKQGYVLSWPVTNDCPEPVTEPEAYKETATARLTSLVKPGSTVGEVKARTPSSTLVFPLAQYTPLFTPENYSTEHTGVCATLDVLKDPSFKGGSWAFTAGYFNVHPDYRNRLLNTAAPGTIITASQQANGFYKSGWPSGMLPPAYTLLSKRFMRDAIANGRGDLISLEEWRRGTVGEPDGWTYHAKGLWVTPPESAGPAITLIGSTNFTRRSNALDLEATALVISDDAEYQQGLKDELEWLRSRTENVTMQDFNAKERKVTLDVKIGVCLLGDKL